MKDKLTPKQEAFAVAVAKGATATAAYRGAYGMENGQPKTINEAASRLAANSKVLARIGQLKAPALRRHEASVERVMDETLRAAYGEPDEPLSWPAKLKALDMLFKHFGMFKEDNAQRLPNLALQINLVGTAPKEPPREVQAVEEAGEGRRTD